MTNSRESAINPKDFWPSDHIAPTWLPNWRYNDEYPDTKEATKHDFAWEFLRRNLPYQKDYQIISSLCDSENYLLDRYKGPLGYNIFPPIIEPLSPFSINFHADLYNVLKKWGLSYYLLNPAYDFRHTATISMMWRTGSFNYSTETVLHNGQHIPIDGGIIPSEEEYETPYLFDLSLPLKPQTEAAERVLKKQQKRAMGGGENTENSNSSIKDYPIYLRILDADARGVSNSEIKLKLPSANLFSLRRGAYPLLNGGYKRLR